jgi:anti-anti-sigma regulatory factor
VAGKKAAAARAKLAFCNLSPVIHEGFALTGLTDLFPVFKNENEAFGKLAGRG